MVQLEQSAGIDKNKKTNGSLTVVPQEPADPGITQQPLLRTVPVDEWKPEKEATSSTPVQSSSPSEKPDEPH